MSESYVLPQHHFLCEAGNLEGWIALKEDSVRFSEAAFLLEEQVGVQKFHDQREVVRRGPELGGSHNCSLGRTNKGIKEGERKKLNRAWAGLGQTQGTN